MTVTLTWSEVMQAALVGVMRQVTNLRDRRKDSHGLPPETDGWGIHIDGCCGELAAAKALNVCWTGALGTLRAVDIGNQYQVRCAPESWHRLILHPDDPDDAIFILVTGRIPTYTLAGWIRGRDGKQKQYWDDPKGGRPAFFVPHTALRKMDGLGRLAVAS